MSARPDIDAISARLAAATPGEWEAYDANEGESRPMWCVANDAFHNPPEDEDAPWIAVELRVGVKADADLIANAKRDLAALIAWVGELERQRDAVLALADAYGSFARNPPHVSGATVYADAAYDIRCALTDSEGPREGS